MRGVAIQKLSREYRWFSSTYDSVGQIVYAGYIHRTSLWITSCIPDISDVRCERVKKFVANCVAEIRRIEAPHHWCNVDSLNNPTDIISRELLLRDIFGNACGMVRWAYMVTQSRESMALVMRAKQERVQEFISNCKNKRNGKPVLSRSSTVQELEEIMIIVFRMNQKELLANEFKQLSEGTSKSKRTLSNLRSFVDSNGLIRVGDRPMYIKEKRRRNQGKLKVYVAVLVPLATGAVHLEVVSNLTTEFFIESLKRDHAYNNNYGWETRNYTEDYMKDYNRFEAVYHVCIILVRSVNSCINRFSDNCGKSLLLI
uniref:Uncharacterized protein n=1 Tax=Vespula pensylvanica TaxID=30213 RepID=A0A834NX45_VESPE|nr:hypothetical protein H0235_010383 [Vespula pensylvanica]